jgi:hypothetical protein
MSSLNRETSLKSYNSLILLSFLCLSLAFFFIIRAPQKIDKDSSISLPPMDTKAAILDEPAYEAWIIRYLEEYAKTYYTEMHTMNLNSENIRLSQHRRLANDYVVLFNKANLILPPQRYTEIHNIIREEAWLSSKMHLHYPISYSKYQTSYFQKMKRRNQIILLLEKQEPKLLYRWLIQEKAVFQSNSQDK